MERNEDSPPTPAGEMASPVTSAGTSSTNRGGRPKEWTDSRTRRLTRLYVYTSLKVGEILKGLEDGKETADRRLNHLLGKDPRWIRPTSVTEARQRVSGLKNSERAKNQWILEEPGHSAPIGGVQEDLGKIPSQDFQNDEVGQIAGEQRQNPREQVYERASRDFHRMVDAHEECKPKTTLPTGVPGGSRSFHASKPPPLGLGESSELKDIAESLYGDSLNSLVFDGFEYADSDQSRPGSRSKRTVTAQDATGKPAEDSTFGSRRANISQDVDTQLMNSFQDLKACFTDNESDDGSDAEDVLREIQRWRREKRARRMNPRGMSMRTFSERASDSDQEDLEDWDTGYSNQRRLRRKIDRRSLLSIPPEIAIELKEPNSDGEVVWDEHEIDIARELPFWTMEVETSDDSGKDEPELGKDTSFRPPATQSPNHHQKAKPHTSTLVGANMASDSGYGTASHTSDLNSNLLSGTDMPDLPMAQQHPSDQGSTANTDNADRNTIYSVNYDLTEDRVVAYVTALAEDLFDRLQITALKTHPEANRIASVLPGFLRGAALKLGYEASSQALRDIMVFIHRYRHLIAESFMDISNESMHREKLRLGEKNSTEIVRRWLGNSAFAEPNQSDEELEIPGMAQYRELVQGDSGYEWLLNRLQREVYLSTKDADVMIYIRQQLLQAMPMPSCMSRKAPSQLTRVTYSVDWDILTFIDQQRYKEPRDVAIAGAITLTGSQLNAQALSCREYLAQTWPSTGTRILELIQELLRGTEYLGKCASQSYDGVALSASIEHGTVNVTASGVPDFVAEVGEQLAWLGAALHPSSSGREVQCCTPYISHIQPIPGRDVEIKCDIAFKLDNSEKLAEDTNGQCWHGLFNGPVIVPGFPIPLRPDTKTSKGLEIPLGMLVALARTRYVDTFESKIFIKGFSCLLAPTQMTDNILVWHLIFNKNPEDHISYLDWNLSHCDVGMADIERSRHIVGWCIDAACIAGTLQANYSTMGSRLPFKHSDIQLDKAGISAGQIVNASASFVIGMRETPVHISHDGYLTKLQWIKKQHCVFWDTEERRGWLVNGARALLHLLRASLVHSKHEFQSAFLLDPGDLADAEDTFSPEAAIEVLIKEENRERKLYVEHTEMYEEKNGEDQAVPKTKKTYYLLQHRVEQIYNKLDKCIEHQAAIERRCGYQVKSRLRQHLEGWDFGDIVTDENPLLRRVAGLGYIGKGWLELVSGIRALTFFGRGFGELIQPANKDCQQWSSLPVGRDLLAACVGDLQSIMDTRGDPSTNPRRLCHGVVWHTKHTTFQPCSCNGGPADKHQDLVQELSPKLFHRFRKKPLPNLEYRGAVIFGHNWYWGKLSAFKSGETSGKISEDGTDSTDNFRDSGLGSSLVSSASTRVRSLLSSRASLPSNTA